MTAAYRIIKWADRHANAAQRTSGGKWIVCPTAFDSLGLRRLLATKQGVEAFGAYVLLAELAARMPQPGILAGDDGPLEVADIAIITGAPERALASALASMSQPAIGWVDRVPYPECIRNQSGRDPDELRNESGTDPDAVPSPRVRAPACAGGSSSSSSSGDRKEAAAAAACGRDTPALALLRRMRAPAKRLRHVAAMTDLAPAAVLAHWSEVRSDKSVMHVGAVVCRRIESGDPSGTLTARGVIDAVEAGVVQRIDDQPVKAAALRHNAEGLFMADRLIVPAARLGEAVYG